MKVRHRHRSSRGPALLVAVLAVCWLGWWLPALSVAAPSAASELPPSPTGAAKPAGDPPAAGEAQQTAAEAPAALALILPLESPVFGRAAEAVRAGFAAAAGDARYKVIGHSDGGIRPAFDKARAAGAQQVVGPLVRDDLKAIANSSGELPWTIALNQLEDGAPLPPRIFTLTLSIESEGAQLARQAWANGARSVAIIESETPLLRRLAAAFSGEWILCGGDAPAVYRFDRSADMLAALRRELQRSPPDAVLLALDGDDAGLAKAYAGAAATYAGSQVNENTTPELRRDLDGVQFVETPWRANPDAAAFASLPRPDYRSATLERLYALGVDAYRVVQAFAKGPPATLEFDGATGHLALDRNRQFVREGTMLQFRDGEVVPVAPR